MKEKEYFFWERKKNWIFSLFGSLLSSLQASLPWSHILPLLYCNSKKFSLFICIMYLLFVFFFSFVLSYFALIFFLFVPFWVVRFSFECSFCSPTIVCIFRSQSPQKKPVFLYSIHAYCKVKFVYFFPLFSSSSNRGLVCIFVWVFMEICYVL